MENNIELEVRVVDYYCTFNYLLSYIGSHIRDDSGKCFCPFHDNKDTPAAKVYNEDGRESLFCFAEGKKYYPHHLLTKGIVPFSLNHVFSSIWSQLSDSEKEIFRNYIPNAGLVRDYSKYYESYKKGEISLRDIYVRIMEDK